jgi:D-alanine-D-alanine ligase
VQAWIDQRQYHVFMVEIKGAAWRCMLGTEPIDVDKNDFSIVINGERIKFDIALIMIHGTPGEDGMLQGYLEMLGVPHTTCSAAVAALTFSKFACKAFLRQTTHVAMAREVLAGIEQCNSKEVAHGIVKELGMPLFAKPNADGSSFGACKIACESDLVNAIDDMKKYSTEMLVEEYIAGTEVSVGVLKFNTSATLLPITEIVSSNEFFDYEAKYTAGLSQEITPARICDTAAQAVRGAALAIVEALGFRGIGRLDFILRGDVPYFLEINAVPGMSDASIIPQQVRSMGWTMEQVLAELIESSYSMNEKISYCR